MEREINRKNRDKGGRGQGGGDSKNERDENAKETIEKMGKEEYWGHS